MRDEKGRIQNQRMPAADGKTAYLTVSCHRPWETTGRSFLRLEDTAMSMKERMIATGDEDPFTIESGGTHTKGRTGL